MFKRLKVYIELVRPFTLIAPVVGILSGAIIASSSLPGLNCIVAALCAAILNAASNVNNQYFDSGIDKINKPSRPLPSGRISKKNTLIFASALYFAALILSWQINLQFFSIVLITAVVTFFYSAPPIRIKKYVVYSNISIGFTRGMLLIVAGWSVSNTIFCIEPWFIGLIFALYLFGAATTKDFSDMEGDRKFKIETLPVLYGIEKAAKIISPFLYLPFLLIPLGIIANVIRPTALPLTLLSVWGLYTARLILKRPQELALEKNHISWKHMYLMLVVGQIGFAVAYLIKI